MKASKRRGKARVNIFLPDNSFILIKNAIVCTNVYLTTDLIHLITFSKLFSGRKILSLVCSIHRVNNIT